MDALVEMVRRWNEDTNSFARSGGQRLIDLTKTHENDLLEVLQRLADTKVPYDQVEDLTGYSKGTLINRKDIKNVGTKSEPAFRLGDLPYKAGHARDGKLLLAFASLIRQREGRWSRAA